MKDESPNIGEPPVTQNSLPSLIIVGPIHLEASQLKVSVHGKTLRLTPLESIILSYLAVHADTVCTCDQIGSSIWGPGESSLIKPTIHHIRWKIEPDPMHPINLLTIPERGYMLVSQPLDKTNESYLHVTK